MGRHCGMVVINRLHRSDVRTIKLVFGRLAIVSWITAIEIEGMGSGLIAYGGGIIESPSSPAIET